MCICAKMCCVGRGVVLDAASHLLICIDDFLWCGPSSLCSGSDTTVSHEIIEWVQAGRNLLPTYSKYKLIEGRDSRD